MKNEELMQWIDDHTRDDGFINSTDVRELAEGMRLVPEALQPSGDAGKSKPYWWCAHCKEEVDGRQVTYQEYHESCGYKVECRDKNTPEPSGEVVSVVRVAVLFAIESMRASDNVLQHYAPHTPEAKLSAKMIGQLESALSQPSTVSDGKEG